jgi:hypothetical protein
MKKSYYCIFGTNHSIAELVGILVKNFDMEFVEHESSYFGNYLLYSGLFADKLTIRDNSESTASEDSKNRFGDYAVIINLSNNNGKNSDKLSRTNYLKKQFSQISNVVLLEETIFEE